MAQLTLLKLIVNSEITVHHESFWGCWVLKPVKMKEGRNKRSVLQQVAPIITDIKLGSNFFLILVKHTKSNPVK